LSAFFSILSKVLTYKTFGSATGIEIKNSQSIFILQLLWV